MDLAKTETFLDILSKLKGTSVDIVLKNGQSISGKIKIVGQFCTQVEREDSKSFYDIIIRNEDISTVEMRVRA
ncbi:MAG: hypothetical protein RBG13Loki_0992 [Promethearchaeota archaeon CR_4]|nr:MAG: hypothetical protein RBG13Loki_0992 [Candidatus Lokiarchaeota archaeon CR_4]